MSNNTQIDNNDKKNVLAKLTKLRSLSDNDPLFMHLVDYYITYAQSAFELLRDNYRIDWLKHGGDVIQTATSFFGVGKSKLGTIGTDIFEGTKAKLSKLMTLKKYEQILLVIGMQSACITSVEEFKKVSILIKEALRSGSSYEVFFAHIEVLEGIIRQSEDPQVQREAFNQICGYTKDEVEAYSKLKESSWMVKERAYHTLLQMEHKECRLCKNELLSSAKEVIDERRKNEKQKDLRRALQYSTEIVKVYHFIDNTLTDEERNRLEALQTVRNAYLKRYGEIKYIDDERGNIDMEGHFVNVEIITKSEKEKKKEKAGEKEKMLELDEVYTCLLYTSPSPRDS
eukprot:TRINITY_DN4545_c0_g1_i12.p1 TRINITY_DN4545_c0_g1~~TRINITY_DN4545_c0_g1_i12.p1  ORF type:complete len:342 (+),score=74.05 TRINITY_DN4545_c0_g1_i12:454-1479(+)